MVSFKGNIFKFKSVKPEYWQCDNMDKGLQWHIKTQQILQRLSNQYLPVFGTNKSNNQILNSKGNVQKYEVDIKDWQDREIYRTIDRMLSYSWFGTGIFRRKWWVKPGFMVDQTSHLYDNIYSSVSKSQIGYCKIWCIPILQHSTQKIIYRLYIFFPNYIYIYSVDPLQL